MQAPLLSYAEQRWGRQEPPHRTTNAALAVGITGGVLVGLFLLELPSWSSVPNASSQSSKVISTVALEFAGAHTGEMVVNSTRNIHGSMTDKLFDHVLQAHLVSHVDLQTVALGKPGHLDHSACPSWQHVQAQNSPCARSSHSISVIGSRVFLFGGEHIARTPIDSTMFSIDLPISDSSSPVWQSIDVAGDKPVERIAHAQAVIGNCIYVFGGRQGVTMEEKPLNDLWRFDTLSSTWSFVQPKDSSKVPDARSFHTMVSVDDRFLYVFAGCAAVGRLNDLHRFDTITNEWEQMPSSDALAGRGGPCFVNGGNGSLYVVAGFAGRETNDMHRFDVASKQWIQLSDAGLRPRSVCAHCSLAAGNSTSESRKVLIFGGEVDPSDKGHMGAGSFANDSLLFDPVSGQITTLSVGEMSPPARGWSSMAACADGRVVLFGGLAGDDENPKRLSDLWMLSGVCQ